jgi:hypothetical protein
MPCGVESYLTTDFVILRSGATKNLLSSAISSGERISCSTAPRLRGGRFCSGRKEQILLFAQDDRKV